jgi:hypothetical protein
MAKEYKVTMDQSLKAENNAATIEKKMQELARDGWEFKGVTSIVAGGSENLVNASRIYLFWERDEPRK